MAAGKPNKHRPLKKAAARAARQPKAVIEPKAAAVIDSRRRSERLSNVLQLTRKAWAILWLQRRLFAGILAVYAVLNIIFVSGLTANIQIGALRDQFANRFVGSLATYSTLVGSSGTNANEAGSVYQLVLFMIVSLALIWALRQVYADKTVRIRDAFYRGMYPLVPVVLVLLFMCAQLLPTAIGSAIYSRVAASAGQGHAMAELIAIILALGMLLLSLYWLASSVFAFYIATLSDMTPIPALQAAKRLVAGRRWTVLRKVVFLPLLLVVLSMAVMLPVIFVVPVIAPWCLAILGPVVIALAHSYMYGLYRELVGE